MLRRTCRSILALLCLAACATSAAEPADDARPHAPAPAAAQDAGQDAEAQPAPPRFQTGAADRLSAQERAVAARSPLAHVTVSETAGRQRDAEALTFGVPFARGRLRDASLLRAWTGPDGAALPLQTRALSRWPDDSLRWVLVDTRLGLAPRAERIVTLGLAEDLPATPDAWRLEQVDGGGVALHDGALRWSVLERSAEGDAVAGLRALLTDRFGHEYVSRVDGGVQWVEWGPLRATARLRGAHRSASDMGLDVDFHAFTVWVHFLAGQSAARVEWSLENGPLHDPPGRLAFRSYELLAEMPSPVPVIELPGRTVQSGLAASLAHTAAGEARRVDGVRVAAGPPGDAWIGLRSMVRSGEDAALWVHRVESRQNHPNRFAVKPTEPLRIGLLASEPDAGGEQEFWLDDATRKTFRLNLARGLGGAGRAFVAQASNPAHVALDPFEVRLSRAWGDDGLIALPGAAELSNSFGVPNDSPTGWADWGERTKNTHQTGSPRNRPSVFLESLQTGRADLHRWNVSRAWHAMDLRPYHIRGFSAQAYPDANLYEGVPHWNEKPEKRLGRSEMASRFPEYKQGLPEKGHGYNGFDPEHMALDDVYECYLLTGSWPALDALRSAGEAMLTWWEVKEGGNSFSSRTFGWTLRALVQVHRATGDPRYLDAARRMVHREDATRGHGDVKWFIKQKPDNRHLGDKEWDAPWMVSVALRALGAYWHETADPIVPPMARDLTAFCLSAYHDRVFMADVPVDGSPIPIEKQEALGVSLWVPGGIAAAAAITGDHTPVDRVLGAYALLLDHPDKPIALGAPGWAWFQPYRVSLRQRYGAAAVQDPAAVRRAIEERQAAKAAPPSEEPAPPADADAPRKLKPPR